MATVATRLAPERWLRRPYHSARLRLTLLYSGMFLGLGTAVIAVIYLVGATGTASAARVVGARPARPDIVHTAVTIQHSADVSRLLAGAWATLAVTAAVSALLGWFLAGRVLRPLRAMTLAARAISAGNLHERIALTGPEDEFKQLGDTIDGLLARLEAAFAAQRRFVANAAHELRTPLTLERTLLQVALSDPEADTASLRETCQELLLTGRDQERLLDSLLTLATSERGLAQRGPVELTATVSSVLMLWRPTLEQASVEVSRKLEPAWIDGDSTLIERLVGNLVENAVSYNQPGGRVAIQTTTESGRAVLTISNTGPEVSPHDIDRLFEPFRRLGNDRAGADQHHGLGLSIVRAVATAHDGAVTATPNPGGGLSVAVSFLARPEP